MSQQYYNWIRYWSYRNAHINLTGEGFLIDPGQNFLSKSFNPDLLKLESIAREHCIVLLGEPGSGKSTELHQFALQTQSQIKQETDKVIEKAMENYSSDNQFVKDIFDSVEIKSWIEGKGDLFLFLDSFDEAMITISKISNCLSLELTKLPINRLFFRIACRSLDWPSMFERQLVEMWGRKDVHVLEIAPLRKQDIENVLDTQNLNSEIFFNEVFCKEVIPLTLKPITLFFLIKIFESDNKLPLTKIDLYEKGCEFLCQEVNPSRRDSRQTGNLSAKERLVIAGRIAAIMQLTKKSEFCINTDSINLLDTVLNIESVIGYEEEINGIKVDVKISSIHETLNSGLFNMRDSERYGFVHQSYEEFLAAWYINHRKLPLQQLSTLFTQPFDNKMRIVPQLAEVTAWLASFSEEFFNFVLLNDPIVLLLGDTSNISDEGRSNLTKSILSIYEDDQFYRRIDNRFIKFRKLKHPELEIQLSEIIKNTEAKKNVRGLALEIATSCKIVSMQNLMVNIALDANELIQLRVIACEGIIDLGSLESKQKLKPLAFGLLGDDPEDELKGFGLEAVWPNCITSRELFHCLTPVKQQNLFGSYVRFILKLQEDLSNIDLQVALNWAKEQTNHESISHEYNNLINSIIIFVWERADNLKLLSLLAETLLGRIINLHPIIFDSYYSNPKVLSAFQKSYREKTDQRHNLLITIIQKMVEIGNIDAGLMTFTHEDLVLNEDFYWVVDQIENFDDQTYKQFFADIALRLVDKDNPEHVNAIYNVIQKESTIKNTFHFLFGPIQFDSPEIKNLKKFYEMEQKYKNKRDDYPSLHELVIELLDKYDAGDRTAWWMVNHALAKSKRNQFNSFYTDITKTPGWEESEQFTKDRIIKCAKDFISYGDPENQKWFLSNSIYYAATSGYRAIYLIYQLEPEYFRTISKTIFKKWMPIVIEFSSMISDETAITHNEILRYGYHLNPKHTIALIDQKIDSENVSSKNIFFLGHIEAVCDKQLNDFLLSKMDDKSLSDDSYQNIAFTLLRNEYSPAIELFTSQIQLNSENVINERLKRVLKGLIIYSPKIGWKLFIELIQKYQEDCKEILLSIAISRTHQNHELIQFITEDEIYKLSSWLFKVFPTEEDIVHNSKEMYSVTSRDEVGLWRDSIARDLARVGTIYSYQAIKKLSEEFPSTFWLKALVVDAEALYRKNNWKQASVNEILKLMMDSNLRLVQNAEQLQDVIIESLERLQKYLDGETPESPFLWDKLSQNKYRPKEENRLSDYVKIHLTKDLKARGIISNREVEIRPNIGSATGENTDVFVEAVIKSPVNGVFDRVTVIIETKCAWNPNLLTDMKDQLVERYLHGSQCRVGIFLVGWYTSMKWDNEDRKYTICKQLDKQQLLDNLNNQASSLSTNKSIKLFLLNVAL